MSWWRTGYRKHRAGRGRSQCRRLAAAGCASTRRYGRRCWARRGCRLGFYTSQNGAVSLTEDADGQRVGQDNAVKLHGLPRRRRRVHGSVAAALVPSRMDDAKEAVDGHAWGVGSRVDEELVGLAAARRAVAKIQIPQAGDGDLDRQTRCLEQSATAGGLDAYRQRALGMLAAPSTDCRKHGAYPPRVVGRNGYLPGRTNPADRVSFKIKEAVTRKAGQATASIALGKTTSTFWALGLACRGPRIAD
jgi:hypothetical protein